MLSLQTDEQLISQLCEHQPETINWFVPVWEESSIGKKITDFEVRYCNTASCKRTGLSKMETVGKRILADGFPDPTIKSLKFTRCLEVYETAEAMEYSYFSPHFQCYLTLSWVRVSGGVLVTSRDRTQEYLASQQRLLPENDKEPQLVSFADPSGVQQPEQEATQNANELQAIFNASMSGVYSAQVIYDTFNNIADLRFLRVNNSFQEMFGLREEDIIGNTLLSISPEIQNTPFLDDVRQVFRQGSPLKNEVYNARTQRWFEFCMMMVDHDKIAVTVNDITQQKQRILEIEQQKNLLDNILRYSLSGISVSEAIRDAEGRVYDGRTLLANDAAVRYTGLPKEVYLGKTALELDPGMGSSLYFLQCLKALETGEPFLIQFLLEPTNRWLELSVSRMDADHLIHIFTDVTATREVQNQVERSAEKLNTIINTSQAGFFLCRPILNGQEEIIDFRFTMVNHVLAAFVDKQPEALIGEPGSRWFVNYKNNGLFEHFRNTYLTGTGKQFDFHYVGETVEVWANIMLTKLGDEILGTFTDFTPVKKLQLQHEKMVEELKRSNANLEEFAYIASHDLQEPLRKIQLLSERMKVKLAALPAEDSLRILERMVSAIAGMKDLINDLLLYSQLSVQPDVFRPVDLNHVVHQVLQNLEASITETSAQVTLENLPYTRGDERQLRQLFQNLIGNSLKYRKAGTIPAVTISCRLADDPDAAPDFLPKESAEKFYHIAVKDNGIGFEQEYAEKIFQVFQRLHGRSAYNGTGVGLAIVKKVVTNHKGYINATSEPGQGSTFNIYLPLL